MHAGRLAVTLGLTLLAAAGCAEGVKPDELQAWVGRPVAALERDWGVPTREVVDGDVRILIYEEVRKTASQTFASGGNARNLGPAGAGHAIATEVYRTPTVYVRSYLFWVDREGKIVNSAVHQP